MVHLIIFYKFGERVTNIFFLNLNLLKFKKSDINN